jgi:CheY-like chemotaxis protein
MTTSPRILVIEGDLMVRQLLCDILESDGYLPLMADDWLDPEDVRQLRPTAILADPFADGETRGWDYLRLLRAHPGLGRIPVVICTAAGDRLREVTVDQATFASTVIRKPFDLDELLAALGAAARPIPRLS